MDNREFNPDWGSHPGATIQDIIEEWGQSYEQVSVFTGIDIDRLKGICQELEEFDLTEEDCEGLTRWSGLSENFWRTRNEHYRDHLRKRDDRSQDV